MTPKEITTETGTGPGTETEYVDENGNKVFNGMIDLASPDAIETIVETLVGVEGMRIDREGFKSAVAEDVVGNVRLKISGIMVILPVRKNTPRNTSLKSRSISSISRRSARHFR